MDSLIYVIAGKEDSLVNAQCQELIAKFLEPQQRAMGLSVYQGDEITIAEVLDELRTVPFLTDKRVVVVKQAEDFVSKYRQYLEKYFYNPCPTARLVLVVTTWQSSTKLAKKLPQVGRLINVAAPKRWQLPAHVVEYALSTYHKKLDKNAAELLVDLAGDDLLRLYSEVDKLALFIGEGKTITTDHVESLVGHNRIFDAFEVIDAVTAGNTGEAIVRLRNMFSSDKSAEYTVVGAFAYHIRQMFSAKALLQKGADPADIAKQLRIWRNKDRFFAQLRQVTLEQIAETLRRLATIDYETKTGRTKAAIAIEQLVLEMTISSSAAV
jgi:DNA polymerase-3 subunit delta